MLIKEENLIQYEGTLKVGQRLVKVGDTFIPVGVGGAFEQGSGEADTTEFEDNMLAIIGDDASIPPVTITGAKYYKCVSVDTTAKTWSGYELILENGKYTVSTTLTTGLTYTTITPVAGTVYSEDALIEVGLYCGDIPTIGQVLYVPLSADSTTTETGQTITKNGTATYQTIQGIPFCNMSDGNYLAISPTTGFPSGDSDRTLSFWLYASDVTSRQSLFAYGSDAENNGWIVEVRNNHIGVVGGYNVSNEWECETTLSANTVYHIAVLHQNSSDVVYVNNEYAGTFNYVRNTLSNTCIMFVNFNTSIVQAVSGTYVSGIRLYNRALTENEIALLSNEFTPTE